jgi:hypothetical protein
MQLHEDLLPAHTSAITGSQLFVLRAQPLSSLFAVFNLIGFYDY